MDEAVDTAVVAGREVGGPRLGRNRVEEIDDVGLDGSGDLCGELVEARLVSATDAGARPLFGKASHDRGAEVPGSAGDGDDASVQRASHDATLATVWSEE
jgi:hypothetical protein